MVGISKFKNDLSKNINSLDVEKETFRNVITGNIYKMMNNEKITKSDLAKSLNVSKPAITKMLSGDRNFTIDKISEICHLLGYNPKILFRKKFYLDNKQKHLLLDYFEKKEKEIVINKKVFESSYEIEIKYKEKSSRLIQLYKNQDQYYEQEL